MRRGNKKRLIEEKVTVKETKKELTEALGKAKSIITNLHSIVRASGPAVTSELMVWECAAVALVKAMASE